jgi:hypothetical protein
MCSLAQFRCNAPYAFSGRHGESRHRDCGPLVSNCDLHSCTALSNTGDARSVHLAGFEMASRRQTISHHILFFTFTGAWSYSLLRVREEES